jgi:hypothetical protein
LDGIAIWRQCRYCAADQPPFPYDFFNQHLFDGKLPGALLTMQRSKRTTGYYCSTRFGRRDGDDAIDEIALNPATFLHRTDREIVSTLVHEQAHRWQFHYGKPGRRGYHNREWAAKMLELGLIPSDTGWPGGKQTGQRVTHYIEENGAYDTNYRKLESLGFKLDYQDRHAAGPDAPRKLKARYACPLCSIHVWGKPDLRIACVAFGELMT